MCTSRFSSSDGREVCPPSPTPDADPLGADLLPRGRMTDMCKNITLAQLCLRAIKMGCNPFCAGTRQCRVGVHIWQSLGMNGSRIYRDNLHLRDPPPKPDILPYFEQQNKTPWTLKANLWTPRPIQILEVIVVYVKNLFKLRTLRRIGVLSGDDPKLNPASGYIFLCVLILQNESVIRSVKRLYMCLTLTRVRPCVHQRACAPTRVHVSAHAY